MKYMLLIQVPAERDPAEASDQASFEDWMLYDKQVRDSGVHVAGHSLADLTTSTSVRVDAQGGRTITDGPFAEAREVLGGYY
ncbi:MAG TPA: YciI family protein, partial [Actinomycetales bacterium]